MSTLIIAEAGINHNGDIEIAKKLVDIAAEAGADYVKFHAYITEKGLTKNIIKAEYQIANTGEDKGKDPLEAFKKLEFSEAEHDILFEYSKQKGIKFLSTAFDTTSLDMLNKYDMPFVKIPSGEIVNMPYLRKVGKLNKQVILSTGMANLGDIEAAIDVLEEYGTSRKKITVLHCNTEYPTPMKDVNLSAMVNIGKAFNVPIGYSDHTLGVEIPIAAVALGATIIEKHFTLDRSMKGFDHAASLEPDEFISMVKAIRNIEVAMGDGIKRPSDSEKKNIPVARKSLYINQPIKKGTVLTEDDLVVKRPGVGISPMEMDRLIGKTILKDMEADEIITWSDIS